MGIITQKWLKIIAYKGRKCASFYNKEANH